MSRLLLQALCRTNQGLLDQKTHLLRTLLGRFGPERTTAIYTQHAPGSVGQHVRHSLDHMAYAVDAAAQEEASSNIHYDRRKRATPEEQSVDHALERIAALHAKFQALQQHDDGHTIALRPVTACFMLSSDATAEEEAALPSTVARELGFAAHHAMHHMAMIQRILVVEGKVLTSDDLPPEFGTAPSTVSHQYRNNQQK